MNLLNAALAWHDAGYTILRASTDGSKRPAGTAWKQYQTSRPDRTQIQAWFRGNYPGIGMVCGAISGGAEMLELEGRAVGEGTHRHLLDLIDAAGLRPLWEQIATGYAEDTPSGGIHWIYRIADAPVPPNTKLACRPATQDELAQDPKDKIKVLAETRGEGGWVVIAPSNGATHPTGRPWLTTAGGPTSVATITMAEREQLHRVIRCLDQMPSPIATADTPRPARPATDGLSPGDDYEARTGWADLLGPHGWTLVSRHGNTHYWRRPGKDRGISATTGQADDRDRLYVFSTSTEFDTGKPYTIFGAYALLEHSGDHKAAAQALNRAGYGSTPPAVQKPPADQEAPPAAGRRLEAIPASSMRMRAPRWLADKRIPAGAITLLGGREGIGKSTISYDLAARITLGTQPGRYLGTPRAVAVVATEDAWEEVIVPRLVAAGADRTRVLRVDARTEEGRLDAISVPADLTQLATLCAEHDIALVIIDPLMSVIHGSLDTHKDRDVRQALDPLARFARDNAVAVLGLIHVNKTSTTDPLNSIMASRAFTATARSVLYCIVDPESEREDRYLFGHPKSNLGPKQPTIRYHLIEVRIDLPEPIEGDPPFITTSRVIWDGDDDRSIRDAMQTPTPERADSEVTTRIIDWLTDQHRAVPAAELVTAFNDVKRNTLDKHLSRLVQRGKIVRPFHGHYSLAHQSGTPLVPARTPEVPEVPEPRAHATPKLLPEEEEVPDNLADLAHQASGRPPREVPELNPMPKWMHDAYDRER